MPRIKCWMAIVVVFVFAAASFGDDPEIPLGVNPTGEPRDHAGKGKKATFYVWYDDGLWHLRTRTGGNARKFSGTIRSVGGKVIKLSGIAGLEARKKSHGDIGTLNRAQTEIKFDFRTKGGEDGFDFRLADEATVVVFDLALDGYGHADAISVGAKGLRPPKSKFALPARPAEEQ